jgi:hypothetical protein
MECSIKILKLIVGFEVHTAVVTKDPIFWDITPSGPLKVNQRAIRILHCILLDVEDMERSKMA